MSDFKALLDELQETRSRIEELEALLNGSGVVIEALKANLISLIEAVEPIVKDIEEFRHLENMALVGSSMGDLRNLDSVVQRIKEGK